MNTLQKRVNGRRIVGAEVISPSSNMTATVCSHMHSYSAPKSSCAWIHVDNDVNTSHSKGDREAMGQKKEVIFLSSITLMYSLAPELLRLWEQNSLFCMHGQKKAHTDHNKQELSHSEAVTVFTFLKWMLLEMKCLWKNTYFPLHEIQTAFYYYHFLLIV